MKIKYTITGLDCPNCAAKMEREIKKLAEVENAVVTFLTQKLTIEADIIDDALLDKVQEIIKKVEPECEIVR